MQIKRLLAFLAIILVINIYWITQSQYAQTHQDGLLDVYFLNIGQGDSILFKSPDNKYMLIDGGPGKKVLSELDQVLPGQNIDLIISTHPDSDHLEGLNNILKAKYNIGEVFWNDNSAGKSSLFKDFKQNVVNYPNSSLDNTSSFMFGCCVNISVLWPPPDTQFKDTNDKSITIHLSYGKFDLYSGGDISSTYEDQLIDKVKQDTYEVLKVSHHGSRTSTSDAFLDAISPEVVVISVGEGNTYGHPTQETLDRLTRHDTQIFRTDLDGRVEITTDGTTGYEVDTLKTLEKKEFKL